MKASKHIPVVQKGTEMTKVRAVFGASYSFDDPSLNNCLYPERNLLDRILDILVKFCFHPVGITSDIRQAFLNVQISGEKKDFFRIIDMASLKLTFRLRRT